VSLHPDDARLLRECLDTVAADLDDDAAKFNVTAFRDMLDKDRPLSKKQRDWVAGVHKRIVTDEPEYLNLVSNGLCPRGREVPTPKVLQNLPLKPPRRVTT
jgi:hypothetical protein